MRTFVRNIIGTAASSAFVAASFFNNQLVWNADRFREPETESVRINETQIISVNSDYNAMLIERHTDKMNRMFASERYRRNLRELNELFSRVK